MPRAADVGGTKKKVKPNTRPLPSGPAATAKPVAQPTPARKVARPKAKVAPGDVDKAPKAQPKAKVVPRPDTGNLPSDPIRVRRVERKAVPNKAPARTESVGKAPKIQRDVPKPGKPTRTFKDADDYQAYDTRREVKAEIRDRAERDIEATARRRLGKTVTPHEAEENKRGPVDYTKPSDEIHRELDYRDRSAQVKEDAQRKALTARKRDLQEMGADEKTAEKRARRDLKAQGTIDTEPLEGDDKKTRKRVAREVRKIRRQAEREAQAVGGQLKQRHDEDRKAGRPALGTRSEQGQATGLSADQAKRKEAQKVTDRREKSAGQFGKNLLRSLRDAPAAIVSGLADSAEAAKELGDKALGTKTDRSTRVLPDADPFGQREKGEADSDDDALKRTIEGIKEGLPGQAAGFGKNSVQGLVAALKGDSKRADELSKKAGKHLEELGNQLYENPAGPIVAAVTGGKAGLTAARVSAKAKTKNLAEGEKPGRLREEIRVDGVRQRARPERIAHGPDADLDPKDPTVRGRVRKARDRQAEARDRAESRARGADVPFVEPKGAAADTRPYSRNPAIRAVQKQADLARAAAGVDVYDMRTGGHRFSRAQRIRKNHARYGIRNKALGGLMMESLVGDHARTQRKRVEQRAKAQGWREADAAVATNLAYMGVFDVPELAPDVALERVANTLRAYGAPKSRVKRVERLLADVRENGPAAIVNDSELRAAARELAGNNQEGERRAAETGYGAQEALDTARLRQLALLLGAAVPAGVKRADGTDPAPGLLHTQRPVPPDPADGPAPAGRSGAQAGEGGVSPSPTPDGAREGASGPSGPTFRGPDGHRIRPKLDSTPGQRKREARQLEGALLNPKDDYWRERSVREREDAQLASDLAAVEKRLVAPDELSRHDGQVEEVAGRSNGRAQNARHSPWQPIHDALVRDAERRGLDPELLERERARHELPVVPNDTLLAAHRLAGQKYPATTDSDVDQRRHAKAGVARKADSIFRSPTSEKTRDYASAKGADVTLPDALEELDEAFVNARDVEDLDWQRLADEYYDLVDELDDMQRPGRGEDGKASAVSPKRFRQTAERLRRVEEKLRVRLHEAGHQSGSPAFHDTTPREDLSIGALIDLVEGTAIGADVDRVGDTRFAQDSNAELAQRYVTEDDPDEIDAIEAELEHRARTQGDHIWAGVKVGFDRDRWADAYGEAWERYHHHLDRFENRLSKNVPWRVAQDLHAAAADLEDLVRVGQGEKWLAEDPMSELLDPDLPFEDFVADALSLFSGEEMPDADARPPLTPEQSPMHPVARAQARSQVASIEREVDEVLAPRQRELEGVLRAAAHVRERIPGIGLLEEEVRRIRAERERLGAQRVMLVDRFHLDAQRRVIHEPAEKPEMDAFEEMGFEAPGFPTGETREISETKFGSPGQVVGSGGNPAFARLDEPRVVRRVTEGKPSTTEVVGVEQVRVAGRHRYEKRQRGEQPAWTNDWVGYANEADKLAKAGIPHAYVGRGEGEKGRFGNPFSHKDSKFGTVKVETQHEAVWRYEEWINLPEQAALREDIKATLKGKVLLCYCRKHGATKGGPCHAQVLARIANGETPLNAPASARVRALRAKAGERQAPEGAAPAARSPAPEPEAGEAPKIVDAATGPRPEDHVLHGRTPDPDAAYHWADTKVAVDLQTLREQLGPGGGFIRGRDAESKNFRYLRGPTAGEGYVFEDLIEWDLESLDRVVKTQTEREKRTTWRRLTRYVVDTHALMDRDGEVRHFETREEAERDAPEGYVPLIAKERGEGQWVVVPKGVERLVDYQIRPNAFGEAAPRFLAHLGIRATLPFSVGWHAGNTVDVYSRVALSMTPEAMKDGADFWAALKENMAELDPQLVAEMEAPFVGYLGSRSFGGPRLGDIARGPVGRPEMGDEPTERQAKADRRRERVNEFADRFTNTDEFRGINVVSWITDKGLGAGAAVERSAGRKAAQIEGMKMAKELGLYVDNWVEAAEKLAKVLEREPTKLFELQARTLEIIGDYTTRRPGDRLAMAGVDPFWQWMKAANKFVWRTLPEKHPIKTAILLNVATWSAEERRKAGLDFMVSEDEAHRLRVLLGYRERQDPFFAGAVATGEGDVVPTAPLTSFGEAASLSLQPDRAPGRIGGFFGRGVASLAGFYRTLPEVGLRSLPDDAGPLPDWMVPDGEKKNLEVPKKFRRQRALGQVTEPFVKGGRQARAVMEGGGVPAPHSAWFDGETFDKTTSTGEGLERILNPLAARSGLPDAPLTRKDLKQRAKASGEATQKLTIKDPVTGRTITVYE